MNRFVFDAKSMMKRKVSKILEFPKELDMGDFVDCSEKGSDIYDLSAVLLHNGPSTNCGHYIARVYDFQ